MSESVLTVRTTSGAEYTSVADETEKMALVMKEITNLESFWFYDQTGSMLTFPTSAIESYKMTTVKTPFWNKWNNKENK